MQPQHNDIDPLSNREHYTIDPQGPHTHARLFIGSHLNPQPSTLNPQPSTRLSLNPGLEPQDPVAHDRRHPDPERGKHQVLRENGNRRRTLLATHDP
jgi:hypothetical protein